jgi:hypothetical protein
MYVTIARNASYWRPTLFTRRQPVFILSLAMIFSDEEMAIIEQRNLYDMPIMDRPYHPLHGKDAFEWQQIQALPVGVLTYLHRTQRTMEIAYYHNDFDAEAGERQLRKGLETLKGVMTSSKETDRSDQFEL